MTKTACRFLALLVLSCLCLAVKLHAADLPTAAGSPIAGITFDDKPLLLPVQRNFQMAMLTASSELGRSCGRMEAYGWRLSQSEQQRVNTIFNSTVDRMRAQGFVVESKAPSSVAHDVTLFAADRPDKHLIFMWSAGEIGLVMVLCETSAPMGSKAVAAVAPGPAPYPNPMAVANIGRQPAAQFTRAGKPVRNFSPVGDWVGTYTCTQGVTGGTLLITSLRGERFEGVFRFYPTPKNPYVPSGRYTVYGDYDSDSQRILVNPGKWIQRPKNFYNTIMIGSFDPVARTFSGVFQGITGCTSFEAKYSVDAGDIRDGAPHRHGVATPKHKAHARKSATARAGKVPAPEAATAAQEAPSDTPPSSGSLGTVAMPAAVPAPTTGTVTPVMPATAPPTSIAPGADTSGIRLGDQPAAASAPAPAQPTPPSATPVSPDTANSPPVPVGGSVGR